MRNSEHIAAGLVLVILHPTPQIARIGAANGWGCRIGQYTSRPFRTVAEYDIAVQIIAAHQRGPFKGNERGKTVRFVERFGGLDKLIPDALISWMPRLIIHNLRQLALGKQSYQLERRIRGFLAAFGERFVELLSQGIGDDIRHAR